MLTKTNARLKEFVDRFLRLDGEAKAIAADKKALLEEAKNEGLTPSAVVKAAKVSSLDETKRKKFDAEQLDFELYLDQLDGKAAE